ncbi:MAG: PAS domain-containing protein, partial [Thermoanaerobaculia bacterium]|nr:PAS domain-containing protein [Thermoanaerobaculia bacterium]
MRDDDGTIPAAWLARSAVVVYALRPDDRRCEFVTPNVEALTGSSVGEAMAPGWWRDRLHPDDRDRLLPRQAEPGDGAILSDDYRFRHRDGHDLWLRDQRRLVREPDGSARVVGTW